MHCFEKIHSASSEVVDVKRSFLWSLRLNFGFHLFFASFHLEFSSLWVSRSFDLGDLSNFRNSRAEDFHSWQFWTFRMSPFTLWPVAVGLGYDFLFNFLLAHCVSFTTSPIILIMQIKISRQKQLQFYYLPSLFTKHLLFFGGLYQKKDKPSHSN